MSSGLQVTRPGFFSVLQDLGRNTVAHLGVSSSGVLDSWAAHWANRLCGNASYMPLLEIFMGGVEFVATSPTVVCVTGADVKLLINGYQRECWQSHVVRSGDLIHIERPSLGVRNYLAVRGGFIAPAILGSVATNFREGIGGFQGQGAPIKKGDVLPYQPSKARVSLKLEKKFQDWSWFDDVGEASQCMRLIPCAQYYQFPKQARKSLLQNEYQISPDSNRMGYRLQGDAIEHDISGILSEATGLGAIQIPNDGQPIILMQDRQTLGGYPKLGVICTIDCWRLAQLAPGESVSFKLISITKAQGFFRRLNHYMKSISPINCS